MGIALRALWAALKDYYEEMFKLAGANLLWLLLAIPIVTLPPATAGLLYLTNQVAHHRSVELRMFFEGLRKYFVKSWLLALLNLLVLTVLWANVRFYGQMLDAQWAPIVQGLFLGVTGIWCLIQLYVFPMLLEQEEPKLLLALRNAALLAFASPVTTLLLGILLAIATVVSVALPLLLAIALAAVVALAVNEAVLILLVHLGVRQPAEETVE
jgi:uncharacterized membrane protein YesL